MNDDNRNERLNERIDLESIYVAGEGVFRFDTTPVMWGADCMICGAFIEGARIPVICNDCRRRLMRVLYPNRREEL